VTSSSLYGFPMGRLVVSTPVAGDHSGRVTTAFGKGRQYVKQT
jgi:hypothetical protein